MLILSVSSGSLGSAQFVRAVVSPDGRYVAIVNEDTIAVVSTATPAAINVLGAGRQPTWSPDSRHLAYYAFTAGITQLWVGDVMTGSTRQLTHLPGGIRKTRNATMYWGRDQKISWSPDGKHLVVSADVETPVSSAGRPGSPQAMIRADSGAPIILTDSTPEEWRYARFFRHDIAETVTAKYSYLPADSSADHSAMRAIPQLFVVDAQTGALAQLTADTVAYMMPDWSPDGRMIVAMARNFGRRSPDGFTYAPTDLYLIDVHTHVARALTHGPGEKSKPVWSPDGTAISYEALYAPWGNSSIELITPRNGEVTVALGRTGHGEIYQFMWDADSRTGYVVYLDGIDRPLSRLNMRTGTLTQVASGVVGYSSLSSTRTGLLVWEWRQDPNGSANLVAWRPGTARPIVLREMQPAPLPTQYGREEVIRWRNHRGDDLDGLVTYPVGYRLGHRYPVVVDGYSGNLAVPHTSGDDVLVALARQGYVVFRPNHRSPHRYMSVMRNPNYDSAATGPHGPEVLVDDILSGVDSLAARGVIDTSRMGLFGFSNGGGSVNYVVTHTKRFKCAISQSPAVVDLRFEFFLANRSVEYAKDLIGASVWGDPLSYDMLSPVNGLEHVVTPMLIAVGDDEQTSALAALEIYTGLRYLGRPVTFVRYPNQGHGFVGAAQQDWARRVSAFFSAYLHPGAAAQ